MIKTRVLLAKLSKKYPKRLAKKNHDFVGLMAGQLPESIARIYLCLDFDETILEDAKAFAPDLIISHHPLVYGLRSRIFKRDPKKKDFVLHLDEINLPVYSFHTNFDEGVDGMNDALARKLDLVDIKPLIGNAMARGGRLQNSMPIEQFAQYAKERLDAKYGLLVAEGTKIINSVAIIGGGGSRSWTVAKEEGYDIYISGDAPHYVRRDITLSRYNYLDLPHEIESIFMTQMKQVLLSIDPSLEIKCVNHEQQPKVVI